MVSFEICMLFKVWLVNFFVWMVLFMLLVVWFKVIIINFVLIWEFCFGWLEDGLFVFWVLVVLNDLSKDDSWFWNK